MKNKFKAKPEQINYTNIYWAPVINCVCMHKGKMLLVKRTKNVGFYPGFWNGISGFLDDNKSLERKVKAEIQEELSISKKDINIIKIGEIFHQEDKKYKKIWIVHPILVKLSSNKILLNWEAVDYKWVELKDLKRIKLVPGFREVINKIFN